MGRKLLDGALLAVLVAVSLIVRCLNFRGVFVGPDVIFWGVDGYVHMRRVVQTVLHFPRVPTFDYFLDFPSGNVIPWPIGYDLLLATFAWLGGLGEPTRYQIESVCALSSPVLGALSVLCLFWVVRALFGRTQAVVAGLVVALAGAHADLSRVGRVDYHVIEPLLPLLLFPAVVRAIESGTPAGRRRYSLLGGVVIGTAFLFWAGATVFAALPALCAMVSWPVGSWRARVGEPMGVAAMVYAGAALVLVPVGMTSAAFRNLEFTSLALSLLQLAVLVGGAAGCALLAWPAMSRGMPAWRTFTIAAWIGLGIMVLLALFRGTGLEGVREGFAYLGKADILSAETTQSRSIRAFTFRELSDALSGLWVLAVPVLVHVGYKHVRRQPPDPKLAYPLAWFLLSAALSAYQLPRYGHHVVLPMGILLGIGIADLQEHAAGTFTRARSQARRGLAALLFVLTMAIPAFLLIRPVLDWRTTRHQNGFPDFPLVNDAFQWLRHETPDPGGVTDPRQRPAYGVLAPWHDGPWLAYIAERPGIASAFILSKSEVAGIRRSVEILLEEDEARAVAAGNRLRVRYVVATNLNPQLETYCRFLGRPADDLMGLVVSNGEGAFRFRERYFRILNNRMLLADGSELRRPHVPALTRFRLAYESPFAFDWNNIPQDPAFPLPTARIAGYKIFEQVRGARIEGRGLPLGRIRAEATIRTNQGRTFVYTQSTRCDEEGRFALVLPYATGTVRANRTAAISPYRITGDGPHADLAVSEDQVGSGARIPIGGPERARSPVGGAGDGGLASPHRDGNARRIAPPGVGVPGEREVSSPAAPCPSRRARAARA